MTFRVGMKCVCIKEGPWDGGHNDEACPNKGDILTIRAIESRDGECWLRFEEIINSPRHYYEGWGEADFVARAFRPLIERKTSISIFTEMLKPTEIAKNRELCGND